jgi:uncharacterized protein YyaL (SSP411 family)
MMIKKFTFLVFILFSIIGCTSSQEKKETHLYTNSLIKETSPYLLQHAHNPVDWRAWNDETLTKAKAENKLMIISIGYSACHWCHVMEHESFEDSLVAATMNSNFISVKVDREERPDIDQIYINAVQLMTGSAGWPLNVVTLPDGRPVWGGTYFKKDDWIQVLERIQKLNNESPEKLTEIATQLEEGIKNLDLVTLNDADVDLKNYPLEKILKSWKSTFDHRFGGYKRAPKFMMPSNYEYLLRHAVQNKDQDLQDHVMFTLDQMAYGGIYDAVGGGFSRYSVDEKWHVPHFEKMLYDNSQLVSLYSNAFKVTKNKLYKEVIEETLVYISEEMTTAEGAFYSSLDADSNTDTSELEEGAYYVYTEKELKEQIGADFDVFAAYFNVNNFGKWEDGKYVLIRDEDDASIAKDFGLTTEVLRDKKAAWKATLKTYRSKRAKPRLDDKTLTSWNGLMLKGYVDAYTALGNKEYLEAALKNAEFILDNQLKKDGSLYHNYKDGKSTINGYLEDYAAVISGFLSLYEVTADTKWLITAKDLADYSFAKFYNEETAMFYFTSSEDPELVSRSVEYRDNVIASSNSIMANNLFVLAHHFDEENFRNTAKQMLKNVLPEIEKYPSGFSNWLGLLENYRNPYYEVAIVGDDAIEKTLKFKTNYLPNTLIASSTKNDSLPLLANRYMDGETMIFVCQNYTCKLPVAEIDEAKKLIE